MNSLIKLFSILFFSSVLISCGGNSHEQHATASDSHSDHDDEHGHDLDHNSDLSIELNNGDKWLVNDEMKPHVEQGEKALANYLESDSQDYKSLATDLKAADKKLISSCTMDGKSHDELHKWLHPHLTLVSDLENAKSEREAAEIVKKLDVSYKNYHTYFQ